MPRLKTFGKGRKPKKRAKNKKKTGRKNSRAKRLLFLIFVTVVAATAFLTAAFERRLLPTVIKISEMKAESEINRVIAESVSRAVDESHLVSEAFYTKSVDQSGRLQTLSVNSLLVDSLCGVLAADISKSLSQLENETVSVPLGVILGIGSLANYGPPYSVSVRPVGTATVDYSSKFEAAGINQINFQIWLQIESQIRIVNPIQDTDIAVSRKVLLVNTLFSGEVPNVYIDTNLDAN